MNDTIIFQTLYEFLAEDMRPAGPDTSIEDVTAIKRDVMTLLTTRTDTKAFAARCIETVYQMTQTDASLVTPSQVLAMKKIRDDIEDRVWGIDIVMETIRMYMTGTHPLLVWLNVRDIQWSIKDVVYQCKECRAKARAHVDAFHVIVFEERYDAGSLVEAAFAI